MNLSVNSTPQAFTSRYRLDANQPVGDAKACLTRDAFIGVFLQSAKNGQEIEQKLHTFFKTEYNKNPNAHCMIEFDLNDKDNRNFEEAMSRVGQRFSKIA